MARWLGFKYKSSSIEDIHQGEEEPPDWTYTQEDLDRINKKHDEWLKKGPTPVSKESQMRRQMIVDTLSKSKK